MKKAVILSGVCLALFALSGCGSSADSLIQQQIKVMNDLADAMEAKDEAKVKQIEAQMKELQKQMKEIKLSEADQKALAEKHKDALMKATGRLMGAALKGGGLPGMPGLPGPGGPEEKNKPTKDM